MEGKQIFQNKNEYLSLLLLADESEEMLDKYLDSGDMFVFSENGAVVGECVVLAENGVCELKNLAVMPACQRRGYGRRIVDFVCERYADRYDALTVGTGESPRTMGFYHSCGFRECGRIPDFFTRHYDHEIVEDGVKLRDMVLLKKKLKR